MSLLFIGVARADVTWETDYELAWRLAKRHNKPLLIDFSAVWCGPCKKMERQTFRDPAVQKLLGRCVCVRVDIDQNPAIAKKFGVNSIPRVFVTDAQGRRLMDVLGYRPAASFHDDFSAALGGKPVIETGGGAAVVDPPELTMLKAQVEKGGYAAWKSRNPRSAAKARAQLVEQLGAFEAPDRDRAARLLSRLGDDAIEALISALQHPQLALRVAANDGLSRLLASRRDLPPGVLPKYDAWAPAAERTRMAYAWAQWWSQHRSGAASGAL